MRALFDSEARRYDVYPLSDQTTMRALPHNRPSHLDGRTHFTLSPDNVRMAELSTVNLKNTSFDLVAHLTVPEDGAEGVLIAQGGSMAGWSLYIDADGRPTYHYNWFGHEHTAFVSPTPLPTGTVEVGVSFEYDGGGLGKGGAVTLSVSGEVAAHGRIERTVAFIFSMSGETMDVGIDTCSPVGPYPHHFAFTGALHRIEIDLRSELSPADHDAVTDGHVRGALRQQ